MFNRISFTWLKSQHERSFVHLSMSSPESRSPTKRTFWCLHLLLEMHIRHQSGFAPLSFVFGVIRDFSSWNRCSLAPWWNRLALTDGTHSLCPLTWFSEKRIRTKCNCAKSEEDEESYWSDHWKNSNWGRCLDTLLAAGYDTASPLE